MPSLFPIPFNPLYLLAPPILLVVSLPLLFFAALTTTLAIVALLARVSIVYVELGGALIRAYIFAGGKKDGKPDFHLDTAVTSQAKRLRRRSDASYASQTALEGYNPKKSDSFASLLGAGAQGPTRDFEGIGGWRDEASDPSEEALWISMNSRLELPAIAPERAMRHHKRSLTSQSQMSGRNSGIWSPEMLRMSPVQSRARTPSVSEMRVSFEAGGGGEEEYFSLQPHNKRGSGEVLVLKSSARRRSVTNTTAGSGEKRRKSLSGDSISSSGSSRGSKGTLKVMGNG